MSDSTVATVERIGVGIIGAGAACQALHLPALAALADRFRVIAVADVDRPRARAVAERVAARAVDRDALLHDPSVEVVLVAGPDAQHAEDVLDAVSAGKRGVLCEKPFAPTVEEAVSMRDAAIAAEVPVVLGAMLEHDPAWSAGWAAFRQAAPSVTFVRSTMVLPHNDVLIGLAAQMVDSTLAPEAQPHSPSPSDFVRAGVLGLASHVVPQMRRFFRRPPRVVAARHVRPWGYHIVLEEEGLVGELLALMPTTYEPHWRFEADGPSGALRLEHPPSFLSAGSSSATVVAADGSSRSWRFPVNGYRGEWLHLHEAVTGAARARGDLDAVVDDVRFATGLIVGAAAVLDTR